MVLAASYEAKAFGVRTPMGQTQALRLCPQAIVVAPRMDAYSAASKAMFEVFNDTAPFVEGLSIDEAFLEVGGLRRISARRPRSRCACARRCARGSGSRSPWAWPGPSSWRRWRAASPPDGLLVVPIDGELAFLIRCRSSACGASGPVTAEKLRERSITTVAEVARLGEPSLVRILGRASGRHIHALAHNRDPRRVDVGASPLDRDPVGARPATPVTGVARRRPHRAVRRLTRRLRRRRVCRTVVLRLRFDDFTRATRSHTLPEATADTATLLAAERALLVAALLMIGIKASR